MPVLAVTGKFSVGDALARSLQPLAERIRGVVHEACGHFIPAEQPERLAEELLAFFAER